MRTSSRIALAAGAAAVLVGGGGAAAHAATVSSRAEHRISGVVFVQTGAVGADGITAF